MARNRLWEMDQRDPRVGAMKLTLCAAIAVLAGCDRAATPLPFLHDDFAGARVDAIHRGIPLFVEVSAPW
jgi:hypothetical protein